MCVVVFWSIYLQRCHGIIIIIIIGILFWSLRCWRFERKRVLKISNWKCEDETCGRKYRKKRHLLWMHIQFDVNMCVRTCIVWNRFDGYINHKMHPSNERSIWFNFSFVFKPHTLFTIYKHIYTRTARYGAIVLRTFLNSIQKWTNPIPIHL